MCESAWSLGGTPREAPQCAVGSSRRLGGDYDDDDDDDTDDDVGHDDDVDGDGDDVITKHLQVGGGILSIEGWVGKGHLVEDCKDNVFENQPRR